MKGVYLGVDIGTTNMKILILGSDGEVKKIYKELTPKYISQGSEFLDITLVERFVFSTIEKVKRVENVLGIAFSSFGESIVPIKNGKRLHDPLMWYDKATIKYWKSHESKLSHQTPYLITGVNNDYTFSIHKIRWYKDHKIIADIWLPVSSYLAYKLCGRATWDYSQACRTFAFNVHSRKWNYDLLKELGLNIENFGELLYTGELVGMTSDNIPIYSAGHDHITGLFAIALLIDSEEFIFDSMGSASVIAAVLKEKKNELHLNSPFMIGGTLGVAFEDKQYYLESSIRHYGRLLQWVLNLIGEKLDSSTFNRLNNEINNFLVFPVRPIFLVNGDLFLRDKIEGVTLHESPLEINPARLMQSAYIYLAASSKLIIDTLKKFFKNNYTIIAGGGGTLNNTLMTYKASLLDKEIHVFPINETTALGAALAAAKGSEDMQTIKNVRKSYPMKTFVPDKILGKKLKITVEKIYKDYREIQKEWRELDAFSQS